MSESKPVLQQSVQFGERYVSSALNRKLAGILDPGVYHGFVVSPVGEGAAGKVFVGHAEDYPFSIAVFERNGYNMTITMKDGGYVDIPAPGEWFIVIEAEYIETQPGYQRIEAREAKDVKDYHIILAKVDVADITLPVTADMIDGDVKQDVQDARELAIDIADMRRAKDIINLSDRLTRLELAQATGVLSVKTISASIDEATAAALSAEGVQVSDNVTVAPVTIVEGESGGLASAALTIRFENIETNNQ